LQQHQEKLQKLRATLEEIITRVEGFGGEVEKRISSEEYLTLVRKTFRQWDTADTEEKRRLLVQLITNAAGTRVAEDDIVRLFLDWLDTYHEAHFAVIREIYKNEGRLDMTSGQLSMEPLCLAMIPPKQTCTRCLSGISQQAG